MQQFRPDDFDTATAFYRDIPDPTAKAVLDFLIDHPDTSFDGAAIVKHLGLARHRDVARAAFALGEVAAALDRKRPWTEAQRGYSMSAEQAALWRRARERAKTA